MCVFFWVGAPFSSYQYWCSIVSKKFLQANFFEAIYKFIVKSILITLSNNHASHLLLPTNLPSYFPLKHALYLIPQTTLAHISNQANFSPKKLLQPYAPRRPPTHRASLPLPAPPSQSRTWSSKKQKKNTQLKIAGGQPRRNEEARARESSTKKSVVVAAGGVV